MAAWLMAMSMLGCGANPATRPPIHVPAPILVDDDPQWSPDGRLIAFHRVIASSLGPPGLYILDRMNGAVRLLLAGDAGYPADLRFSRDGHRIMYVSQGIISAVDTMGARAELLPVSSEYDVEPDWSGADSAVVYSDTQSGLWVYSFAGHMSRPIQPDGRAIAGASYPRWSPSDSLLSFGKGRDICLYSFASGVLTTLLSASAGQFYVHPRWLAQTATLIVTDAGVTRRVIALDLTTKRTRDLSSAIGESEAFSPAADSVVVIGLDRRDPDRSRLVLFVQDLQGRGSRQLTLYAPP